MLLKNWSCSDPIVVTVPDHTRQLDTFQVLEILQKHCTSIQKVVIGLGLHRQMTEDELGTLLDYSKNERLVQHDPDDCQEVILADGRVFGLSKWLYDGAWSITVGVMEIHQYAGVSGGFKGISVGCGSRDFIQYIHSREMVCHSKVSVGKVVDNPFRNEIENLGQASNCRLALAYVPSLEEWWLGHPSALLSEAQKSIPMWHFVDKVYDGAYLPVPSSKAKSFYQASRAATYLALSPNPPLKIGAEIWLHAEMIEGLGSEKGFVQSLQKFQPPWQEVLDGEEPRGAGAQRLLMLALLSQRFHLKVVGCKNPEIFTKIGIEARSDVPKIPSNWLKVANIFESIPQLQ